MLTLKEQAEVCRIGLVIGLLAQRDVIVWADGIIEAAASPDSSVIDISLMSSADLPVLLSALIDVRGEADSVKVVNAILCMCACQYSSGNLTLDEVAAILDTLAPDLSCRRCTIRAEYGTLIDTDTAAAIRTVLKSPDFTSAATELLIPYARFADEITFERAEP